MTNTIDNWLSERANQRESFARLEALLPEPRRTRPRDPDLAEALLLAGIDPGLVGPSPARDDLERVRDVLRERFGDEELAERWLWDQPNDAIDGLPPVAALVAGRVDDVLRAAQS